MESLLGFVNRRQGPEGEAKVERMKMTAVWDNLEDQVLQGVPADADESFD
jgi:ABC-type molybdate transport system substrate-binding protein